MGLVPQGWHPGQHATLVGPEFFHGGLYLLQNVHVRPLGGGADVHTQHGSVRDGVAVVPGGQFGDVHGGAVPMTGCARCSEQGCIHCQSGSGRLEQRVVSEVMKRAES